MRVRTLKTIMKKLGHSFVDVLKFDIEGSEFPFAKSMVGLWDELPVGYIQVEYTSGGTGTGTFREGISTTQHWTRYGRTRRRGSAFCTVACFRAVIIRTSGRTSKTLSRSL
jgi:hypothetical protein